MSAFFPLDSHSMVYFIIREILGFPHQFPIAWENAEKSIEMGGPRKLVPIFPWGMDTFLPSDSRLMVYFTIMEMHGFSHEFLIAHKNATKSPLWAFWLFFHSIIVSTCSKIYWCVKRENRKKTIRQTAFLKKEKPIPGTLEFKAVYYHGCGQNFSL